MSSNTTVPREVNLSRSGNLIRGPLFFPHEHFEKIISDSQVQERIQKTSLAGLDVDQPNLFSHRKWRRIFRGRGKDTTLNSVLTSWGYTKTVYLCSQSLLNMLRYSNIAEVECNPELLFRLPHGCVYIEGPGLWPKCLNVQGTWATVIKGTCDVGQLIWVMNTTQGMVLLDLEFDSTGLYDALDSTVETSVGYFNEIVNNPTKDLQNDWTQSIHNSCRLMFYLCCTNTDIQPRNSDGHQGYMFDEKHGVVEPSQIHFYDVGANTDIGDSRTVYFNRDGSGCIWRK